MSSLALRAAALAGACAIVSGLVLLSNPAPARAGCIGAYLEYKEGQREIGRERREMRRAVRNAGSRREARREIREGMREIARERAERRRSMRRELRPWC